MDISHQILVVDDNATNRRILVKSLGKMGYEMSEASDGFQAVDMATTQHPDLILLDIMMPERDGFEVCSILKAQEATADVPVIFLTAKSESEDLEKAFSFGGCDYITKPFKMGEVKSRVAVHLQLRQSQLELNERNLQLEEMSRVVAQSNLELARHARIDPLTKLLNRRAWEESVTLEHDRFQRSGGIYAIVMIDVDHFKSFNDSQGHQAGDDTLRRVAQGIFSACRTTDVTGRYGGEEFVVLAPETDVDAAMALAERLRQAVFDLTIPHPASLAAEQVTISLGVALCGAGSWEDVLKKADDALYAAKRIGRNRVCADGTCLAEDEDLSSVAPRMVPTGDASAGTTDDRISVLIVDDDPDARALCRTILERIGYRVLEAEDGRTALAGISAQPPHLIVMDVMMPGTDGLECTRRLKANPETQNIPIIISSARATASDIRAGLESGADEFLTKPIKPAELALRIQSIAKSQIDRSNLVRSYEMHGEQTRVLNLLLDLCRALGATENLDEALEETLAATMILAGCRRVSIMMPDIDRQTIRIIKSVGMDQEVAAAVRIPIGESIAGGVLQSGRSVIINSEQETKSTGNAYDSQYFASTPLICTALGVAGQVVGVLNVTDRVEGRPFEPRELDYVSMIANIAGTAVHGILIRQARDDARDAIMVAFAKLAEHRDGDTRKHVDRVTRYCLILAEELRKSIGVGSEIDDSYMHDLERSVPLHDIGKIAVPDHILLKPGRLTAQEMVIMRTHAQIGADTIRTVRERAPGLSMLEMAEEIASSHHEWYDGTGYPTGLQANDIPLSARIAALADVYDAVTTKRPYKDAMSHDQALTIILKTSGTQFDPAVVEAFMRHESEFRLLAKQLADSTTTPPDTAEACGSQVSCSPATSPAATT